MRANTKKFITAYQTIDDVTNTEVIGRTKRLVKEKEVKRLQKILDTCGSKITEEEFTFIASEMCCEWEDFTDTYF